MKDNQTQLTEEDSYLTWDDLVNLYKQRTGGRARIRPMEEVYRWAISQPDITETKNGLLLSTPSEDISKSKE